MKDICNCKTIAQMIFPNLELTIKDLENRYPARELPVGAMVTRIAPSPTGFMHIGGIYAALISERLAHQSRGVFYLRIEDTDKKREVEGATELIVNSLKEFNINIDEGEIEYNNEVGKYGPYKQSDRALIYKVYIKDLIERDLAYPCFSTTDDLKKLRQTQETSGIKYGYYKQWAKWRNESNDNILQALTKKEKFVIRFKSNGDCNNKILIKDLLLGNRELPENDQDIIIMKSDGLPTYHFAHIIDDHLMGTTHVIRGNEWLSSLPLHLQLFEVMGWTAPKYGHIFPIQKMENTSKRKLSKRKDPEANIAYYDAQGYPAEAVIEYLLNLANSNFEDWRKMNPNKNYTDFIISLKKLASSNGPLFDLNKLNDISKNVIARMSADQIYNQALNWADTFDQELSSLLRDNQQYTINILNIDRGGKNPRKDITKWLDLASQIGYFFDCLMYNQNVKRDLTNKYSPTDFFNVINKFLIIYNENDDQDKWFKKILQLCKDLGFAESKQIFTRNPALYRLQVTDVITILRIALTGKSHGVELWKIMKILGTDKINNRLHKIIS